MKPSPYDLNVLWQDELWAGSDASLRTRLVRQDTGKPIDNAKVRIELRQGGGNGFEIDFGLARARHAVEQGRGKGMRLHLLDQRIGGLLLLGRKHMPVTRAVWSRKGAAHNALDGFEESGRGHGFDH